MDDRRRSKESQHNVSKRPTQATQNRTARPSQQGRPMPGHSVRRNPRNQGPIRSSRRNNYGRSHGSNSGNKGIKFLLLVIIIGSLIIAGLFLNRDDQNNNASGVNQEDVEDEEQEQNTEVEAVLDTTAPVIKTEDIYIIEGDTVSYKNAIFYADDMCGTNDLQLSVDNSQVLLDVVGEYLVTCSVTDIAGNVGTATFMVYVEENITPEKEVVYELADAILLEIGIEGKDSTTQARLIYDWIRSHIYYTDHSEKEDWVQGAYEGLNDHKGDCFVYAATAKVLLTRAGIPNEDIIKEKVDPTHSSHYWNLVDTGDGWYHYDTTPRKDGSEFFMLTSAEIEAYSIDNNYSHNYDASLYPEIN